MHQKQGLKIHKAKTDRTERKNRKSAIIVDDFNTSLAATVRTTRQNTGKDIDLKNRVNQQDLTDSRRSLHTTATEYTSVSTVCRVDIKTYHIQGHKTNHNKSKIIDVTQIVFSSHNIITLEIHNIKMRRSLDTCKLSNPILNNPWSKLKFQRKFLKIHRSE